MKQLFNYLLIFSLFSFASFAQTEPAANLCQPTITNLCATTITTFTLNNISVTSGCGGIPNINTTAFSCQTFYKGQSYPFFLAASGYWAYNIWIDNNNDGDFSDVGELLVHSDFNATETGGSFIIPDIGTDGFKHLRILVNGGGSASTDACGSYDHAEVEDYVIRVVTHCDVAIPTITNNAPVCLSNTINISVASPDTYCYKWSGPNSFSSTVKNLVIPDATLAMSGDYSLHIYDTNGCEVTTTTTVIVPSIPAIGSNSPVCDGAKIDLFSELANSYSWTGPNAFTSQQRSPSIANASDLNAGVYTLTVDYSNNCTAQITTYVYVTYIYNPSTFLYSHEKSTYILPNTSSVIRTGSEPVKIYDSLAGGNLLSTHSPYTTPILNADVSYYYTLTRNSPINGHNVCESDRFEYHVKILKDPTNHPTYTCNNGNNQVYFHSLELFEYNDEWIYHYGDGSCNSQGTTRDLTSFKNLSLVKGGEHKFTIKIPYDPGTGPNYEYAFFLDINNDGIFESIGERLNHYYVQGNGWDITGKLLIPPTYSDGYFWMRLVVSDRISPSGHPPSEGNLLNGSAMDYRVFLIDECPRERVSEPLSYKAVCEGDNLNFEFSPGAHSHSIDGPNSFHGGRVSTITNVSMLNEGEYNAYYYYVTGIWPYGSTCRVDATFTVDVVPNESPVVVNVNTNESTNAILSASGCTDGYRWYDEPSGGKMIGRSAQYITPKLYSNTTYYVSCRYGNVCNLSRTPVTVTVNAPCLSALSISLPNYGLDDIVSRKANSSDGLITATNQITNTARVNYQAKAIVLDAGFKAQPNSGGYFKAEIGGCN